MTALVRLDLPTVSWPNWHPMHSALDLATYREKYRKEAQWTIRHLYGAGVMFETDGKPNHPQFIFETRSDKPAGARNVVSLYHRSTYDGCYGKHIVDFLNYADTITAVYIPFGLPADPDSVRLEFEGNLLSKWYRNPDNGLFDAAGVSQGEASLVDLLAAESADLNNAWSGDGSAKNEDLILLRRELKHALEVTASETKLYDWLSGNREAFLHTQDEFIGPFRGRNRWQRFLFMHPCIPLRQIQSGHLRIAFERPTEVLIEYVSLHDHWRFNPAVNPFLDEVAGAVCWIELPAHVQPHSTRPPLVVVGNGMPVLLPDEAPVSERKDGEYCLLKQLSQQERILLSSQSPFDRIK
jgi:hypothetical protein